MIQSPNHRIYSLKDGKLTGALSHKELLLYLAGVKDKSEGVINAIVQKQIERILKELEQTRQKLGEFRKLCYDSPHLMQSLDMNGKIVTVNKMLHSVLGYEDGSMAGKSIRQI